MLIHTFHHIAGIGEKTEQQLWAAGVTDWERATGPAADRLPPKRRQALASGIHESIRYLERQDPGYFERLLPAHLHWRFFPEFRQQSAYLDIETDGLDMFGGRITTIALYDGRDIRWYVNGENLDQFVSDIARYKVIITYNGKCFDIPFIENYFDICMPHAHIDLRYVLGSLGYRGGLKRCEIALGIDRGELTGIDGFLAPMLWSDYANYHNRKALETLLAYNIEDVVNLEPLMVMAYNMKIAHTPFAESHRIARPEAPQIPFRADTETVEKFRRLLCSFVSFK